MTVYLFPNLNKEHSLDYSINAASVLNESGVKVSMSKEYKAYFEKLGFITFGDENKLIAECDIILAVGGDGTILQSAKQAARYQKPVLGLNCGRLGFMCTLEHDEIDLLKNLSKENYSTQKRILIEGEIHHKDGHVNAFHALNDIVVSKPVNSKISDFEVKKNGFTVSSIRADGLIFSTPTGSTAYSLSAGGPIIEPEMECFEFTPICPHTLLSRTIVFSVKTKLSIRCKTDSSEKFTVIVDGKSVDHLLSDENIDIYASKRYIELIDIKGGSFFESVSKKLMRPLKMSEVGDNE